MARARGQWQNRKARKCSGGAPGPSAAYCSPEREGRLEVRARSGDRERGASLVEFALVVPLLTLFLFGIVQFGIAYDKQQSMNSAAREGARLGALASSSLADLSTRAAEAYDASAAPGADPTILVSGGTTAGAATPVGVRCPNGTYRTPTLSAADDDCVSGGAMSNTDANDPELMPCGSTTNPPAYEFVRVRTSSPYDITIPFFGVMAVDIDSEAEFRCE